MITYLSKKNKENVKKQKQTYNIINKKGINVLEELNKLIVFIEKEYSKLYEEWKTSDLCINVHQKNKLVKDINSDSGILNAIKNYRLFINEKHLDLKLAFNQLNITSEINSRVKAQNSIEYKINRYMSEKHEYGEVPLNKCFNDLYGIRIIFNETIEFETIKNFIKDKYGEKLKCYDASKEKYVATHIYFKVDNYSFQWELQIWDKEHERTNIISHEQYKQDYTKWEKENKGGESL